MNRTETPWLIVLMHTPFYNSYNYHYMEGEAMRVVFEPWFVEHKVDVVFAGHVHAYERTVSFTSSLCKIMILPLRFLEIRCIVYRQERISNIAYNVTNGLATPSANPQAPVYVTIGDGGNIEGIASK